MHPYTQSSGDSPRLPKPMCMGERPELHYPQPDIDRRTACYFPEEIRVF
ncbi:hypothetical protein HMPREF9622_02311 [Cutibacterium modestum HL037PA3]|uniref:Uncharacterized protein n=1 Tax=Cutibacterium modestum HL044PA1 TaxID=765109 RepID=A0ABN0C829_9ACTN|nr:hypothetical protein HMPREF9607_00334 [Cutibacterium modestum HL044PA1]EFT14630.1 hypothetical protein HMPREF9622_02311 [Cutibacterium modestum HL037PA3]